MTIYQINYAESYNEAIKEAKAVLYFTKFPYSGECKYLAIHVGDFSNDQDYKDITFYRIITEKHHYLHNHEILTNLKSVPTLQYFYNGAKINETFGTELNEIKAQLDNLANLP